MEKHKTKSQSCQNAVSSSFSIDLAFENIEQMLIEKIADFLDDQEVIIQKAIANLKDPISRGKTELHIRMANMAMIEYKKTMIKAIETNWLINAKTAYVAGIVGFPVLVNIESLDLTNDIVWISTNEGQKTSTKTSEIFQFSDECDFR